MDGTNGMLQSNWIQNYPAMRVPLWTKCLSVEFHDFNVIFGCIFIHVL